MVIWSWSLVVRLALAGVAAGAALTSCSPPFVSTAHNASSGSVEAALKPPTITINPPDGSHGVALDAPVVVSSDIGRLETVSVTETGSSATVSGDVSSDGRTWKSSEGLDAGASYTVTAEAAGAGNLTRSTHASFTTLVAQDRLLTTVSPPDGSVVGVGETIDLKFNDQIPTDRQAALLGQIQVTSTPAVLGAWHWVSPYSVHFRTKDYWPAGTKVTVTGALKGFNVGDGTWGLGTWTSSFTVGDKHVSVIDNHTLQMQVSSNDQLLYTWPVSMGKTGFETLQGTLVVLYKQYDVKMQSCVTFGGAACIPGSVNYYNDDVYWDTAISTTGFFIHAAPWSVYAQGHEDVSHGCVNLSIDRATTFYNFSVPGDVVVINNTGNPATYASGEGDWQIDFSQYSNTPGRGSVWTGTTVPSALAGHVS